MAAGRPTDYTDDFPDKLIEYFSQATSDSFPTMAGFAISIGKCRTTLHDWATKRNEDGSLVYPEFSYVYGRAKDYQENLLVPNALSGKFNPAFSAFFAKNHLDYSDKRELDHTTNGESINGVRDMSTAELEAMVRDAK